MSCSAHQPSCTHSTHHQGDFSSASPASMEQSQPSCSHVLWACSPALMPPGCCLVRCRVCSLECCSRKGAWPAHPLSEPQSLLSQLPCVERERGKRRRKEVSFPCPHHHIADKCQGQLFSAHILRVSNQDQLYRASWARVQYRSPSTAAAEGKASSSALS